MLHGGLDRISGAGVGAPILAPVVKKGLNRQKISLTPFPQHASPRTQPQSATINRQWVKRGIAAGRWYGACRYAWSKSALCTSPALADTLAL